MPRPRLCLFASSLASTLSSLEAPVPCNGPALGTARVSLASASRCAATRAATLRRRQCASMMLHRPPLEHHASSSGRSVASPHSRDCSSACSACPRVADGLSCGSVFCSQILAKDRKRSSAGSTASHTVLPLLSSLIRAMPSCSPERSSNRPASHAARARSVPTALSCAVEAVARRASSPSAPSHFSQC